jgi:putative phosphoribosyl transferase
LLAQDLLELHGRDDLIVLGLPRGGIPVAYEVALALEAPLDAYVVRKLGVPGHEELAMGAIATGDVQILNHDIIAQVGVSDGALAAVVAREKRELHRRERLYRGTQPPPDLGGRTVLLADDGLATGATMRAAVMAVHQLGPRGVIVAVPVAAPSVVRAFDSLVNRIVASITPKQFRSLGVWYEDFSQTTDMEVCDLLAKAANREEMTRSSRRLPEPSTTDHGHPLGRDLSDDASLDEIGEA